MSEFDDESPGQEVSTQDPSGVEAPPPPQLQTLTERASEILARQKEAEGNIDSEEMLRYMDELEAAREVFGRNLATIGEGEDRTLLFQVPQQGYSEEPVVFSVYTGKQYQPQIDMPAGTETTVTDEKLSVNRGGFEKIVTIDTQRVNFDPSSPFFNSDFEWSRKTLPEMQQWAFDASAAAENAGKITRDRLGKIAEDGNYPSAPEPIRPFLSGPDRSRIIQERDEQVRMLMLGNTIGPDKKYIVKRFQGADTSFDKPGERGSRQDHPPRKDVFDIWTDGSVVKVTKPEFIGGALKANMATPDVIPPVGTGNTA